MENILFIGKKPYVKFAALKYIGKEVPKKIHHTISEIGIMENIDDARRSGHPLLLEDVAEFPSNIVSIVERELEVGGFICVAWMKCCPCGYEYKGECRCTKSQIAKYRARITDGFKSHFKVEDVTDKTSAFILERQKFHSYADEMDECEKIRCKDWQEVLNICRRLFEGWSGVDELILADDGSIRVDAWTRFVVYAAPDGVND